MLRDADVGFMAKLLYSLVVGLAVATIVYLGVAVFTTWSVIHSGRSQSAVRNYFLGVTIASLVIGVVAGSWWYRWLGRRAERAMRRLR